MGDLLKEYFMMIPTSHTLDFSDQNDYFYQPFKSFEKRYCPNDEIYLNDNYYLPLIFYFYFLLTL